MTGAYVHHGHIMYISDGNLMEEEKREGPTSIIIDQLLGYVLPCVSYMQSSRLAVCLFAPYRSHFSSIFFSVNTYPSQEELIRKQAKSAKGPGHNKNPSLLIFTKLKKKMYTFIDNRCIKMIFHRQTQVGNIYHQTSSRSVTDLIRNSHLNLTWKMPLKVFYRKIINRKICCLN